MPKPKIVVPGETLAVVEEYLGGENTIEENSDIKAVAYGIAEYDDNKKIVSVKAKRTLKPLVAGAIILGEIISVKPDVVLVCMTEAKKNGQKLALFQSLAIIPIRNIKKTYVRDARDEFRIGDIIIAEVTKVTPHTVELSTSKPEFGVIKAFCSKCRHELLLFGKILRCLNCNNTEHRKLSIKYGKID